MICQYWYPLSNTCTPQENYTLKLKLNQPTNLLLVNYELTLVTLLVKRYLRTVPCGEMDNSAQVHQMARIYIL